MNLDSLLPNLGEWLRGTGPESDVVVSTRIRLARNLAHVPVHQPGHRRPEVRDRRPRSGRPSTAPASTRRSSTSTSPTCPPLDRQFLVERQLISRELATVLEGPRGVAFDERESVSVMVNEEDHLRLQVMRSGFALDEAWAEIDRVDDAPGGPADVRLPRPVRLPDRLPHERRHRHAGERHAAPAGPRASPSRSTRCSGPCRRSTWPSAGCTARAAGRSATCTRSPTR